MLALRQYLQHFDPVLEEAWKYRMPFYMYKERMFCYLWIRKDNGRPYLGVVRGKELEYPELVPDKRKRMKIFLIDPAADLPEQKIKEILDAALALY